jgi:hypothetical protein
MLSNIGFLKVRGLKKVYVAPSLLNISHDPLSHSTQYNMYNMGVSVLYMLMNRHLGASTCERTGEVHGKLHLTSRQTSPIRIWLSSEPENTEKSISDLCIKVMNSKTL